MGNDNLRKRKPGDLKDYDQGRKFDKLYDGNYVYGDKLTEEKRSELNQNADQINEAYYDFITDAYQNGWGNKFHFCGYQPTESWDTAQARHEHYLALAMEMKPGMKVLDLGCGVGGPAREMAVFAGANVTGITINDLHVERANELNKKANLEDQVQITKASFSDLPFADEEFDMAFAIEALGCAPDMQRAHSEVMRVLKPGGKLGILDWVITDKYDDSNKQHRIIRGRIERHGAVPHMMTPKARVAALEESGFEMIGDEDRATAKANPVPWWCFINTLYFVGLIPHHVVTASYTVGECVYSCRDGGKEGIFSPMHMFVARKPQARKV
ncbi:S-adenosyl-L-methionine-dependent methyltransferase [Stemphylium lycopersici]|nr:S-adenosyl-L-methionine-dependent methyltransferase [Stemphylium lycopersici]